MLPSKLPSHLANLQSEVEKSAGRPIVWKESKGISGDMCAEIKNNEPVISYRSITESGIAEELMHLKLIFSGFPQLGCPDNLNLSKQIV